jgi:hypothetical protein
MEITLLIIVSIILLFVSRQNKILHKINKTQAEVITNQQGAIDAYKKMFTNGVTLAPDGFPIFEDGEKVSTEMVILENHAWNKDCPKKKQATHYEVATEKGYANSRHPEIYYNYVSAFQFASTKRNKNDEHDEYWNNQREVITKVTTVKEIVAIVKSEDKK